MGIVVGPPYSRIVFHTCIQNLFFIKEGHPGIPTDVIVCTYMKHTDKFVELKDFGKDSKAGAA